MKFVFFIFFTVLPNLVFAQAGARACRPEEEASFVKLDDLVYLGFAVTGPGICVIAPTPNAAASWCGQRPRYGRAVNPANPQYGRKIEGGDLHTNPDKYYYCVDVTPTLEQFKNSNRNIDPTIIEENMSLMRELNDKEQLCKNIASRLSPWLEEQPDLRFRWSPRGADGDCMCGVGSNLELCTTKPPGRVASAPVVVEPVALPVAVSVPATQVQNPVAASTPAPNTTTILNTCAQEFVQDAEDCKAESERAKQSCDQSSNSGNSTSLASGATQIMGQAYNMRNQAAGMQAECFRAGAVANTASTAINDMQSRCNVDLSSCNRLCMGPNGESKVEEFKRVCAQRVSKTPQQIMAERTPDNQPTPDAQIFASTVDAINQQIQDAPNVCTIEAARNRDKLSQLADGLGRALQSSVQCACQTSSTGRNCQNIPTVQDCTSIPQPAGCGAYEAMATCSVGSPGYDAKACACMQNPASPGCGGGSNAVSAFSGPPIAGNLAAGAAGGGVNFSGGAGGGSGSGFSLAGNGEIENSDLSFLTGGKAAGATAANSSVGGGGAAGPGGGGNGNPSGEKAEPAAVEEKGIGGIFNQAKTFMSNALGLAKKPAAEASGKGAAEKPDLNKFKPNIRGIAGGRASGMGSRNMDIWKMMNACTSGDTCKSNENNYLVAP